ncbi:MAG: HAD-IIIA family hydrolase [bacterium]|nr:HAD-IIIA family hydrolase [bacterium]
MATNKIKTRDELKKILLDLQKQKKKVGFTSGVFDLLHSGHVDYLEKSKSECDLLIVGINSDASVKENKGDKRPIVSETDRCAVISGLASVDFIFLFSETNNNKNIEELKPDLYIKAGDYDRSKLSSASLVESYGGKVLFIPFSRGKSSTSIIEKILEVYALSVITAEPKKTKDAVCKAVFVDRDGTINKEVDYLCDPEKFEILPGVVEGLKKFQDSGFKIIVITNQPGIGFGYYERGDLFKVNARFLEIAGKAEIKISKIYYCPHTKADICDCRKPAIGMLLRAKEEMNVDLSKSFVIGDTTSDILAGKNAGCKTILVKTGKAGKDEIYDVLPDLIAEDLLDAFNKVNN